MPPPVGKHNLLYWHTKPRLGPTNKPETAGVKAFIKDKAKLIKVDFLAVVICYNSSLNPPIKSSESLLTVDNELNMLIMVSVRWKRLLDRAQ